MPDKPFVVSTIRSEYLHMLIDYSKIFDGIQLSDPKNLNISSVQDNGSQLAKKIINNIPNMVLYEE